MMNRITRPLLLAAMGIAANTTAIGETVPPRSLCAPGGPRIAFWQATPTPNKPYIAQLFAPGGEKPLPLLDDSPPDHVHHHGLMFALGVDDTDFWGEKGIKNAGRQKPVETQAVKNGDGFTRTLDWLATDGTALLREKRRVQVRSTGQGADTVYWLDWQSSLSPAPGRDSVKLTGHHYYGLGMRFLPSWADKAGFLWQDTAGQAMVRGDEKLTPGPWCAVHCKVDGRPVTVLMVEHPANARRTKWFTMAKPFCYLSASLGLDTKPATLSVNEHWSLRYGLAVLTGPADHARLTKLATEWRKSALRTNDE